MENETENETLEILQHRKMTDDETIDDIDSDVDELCDTLELSYISERRQLNDIQETKQRIQFLVHQGDEESLAEAADEARALAERIQMM